MLNTTEMKKIVITESQFKKIFEDSAPMLDDNSDIAEFNDTGKVSTTAPVHDNNGNLEYGELPDTDKIGKRLCFQNFFANATGGARTCP